MTGYKLTKQAYTDLLNIWIYIAEDNFDAADRMWDDLEQAMRDLAKMPGMGHRRQDVKNPRYRFWSVYSYVIAYFPDTKPLQIARIVHGGRNFKRLFK